jgi:hypothetical protein
MQMLLIQWMEYDQRVIIRFLRKGRISPEDIHIRLEAQFIDATYSERTVRQWCQYVPQGREDLHAQVPSDRLPTDFLTSEFWRCWTNGLYIGLIRLLKL